MDRNGENHRPKINSHLILSNCRSNQIDQMDHPELPFVRRIHGSGKGALAAWAAGGKD